MGAVNYKTSDYITLAINPAGYYELENDPDFMEYAREEMERSGAKLESIMEAELESIAEADAENAEAIMSKYSFYYYHVKLEPGYYEGLSIDIENNFGLCYDSYQDKQEAQKEITEIKNMLLELAAVGFVACGPGWCTSYSNYNETLQKIREAVREMREEVRSTPTWRQYERESA